MLHMLFDAYAIQLAVLWLAIGVVVSWGRQRGVALVVPLLAAVPTIAASIGAHPGVPLLDVVQQDLRTWWIGAIVPIVGAVAGGLVAEAVGPSHRAERRRRQAVDTARKRIDRIGSEADTLAVKVEAMRSDPQTAPADRALVRFSMSALRTELRQAMR